MQDLNLNLTRDEIGFILQVLGQLPTSSGAYPLVQKIQQQAEPQLKKDEE